MILFFLYFFLRKTFFKENISLLKQCFCCSENEQNMLCKYLLTLYNDRRVLVYPINSLYVRPALSKMVLGFSLFPGHVREIRKDSNPSDRRHRMQY